LRAPQNVSARATASGATVTWKAPAYDYGAPITKYKVYAVPTGINVTVEGSSRQADLTLPGDNAYRFAVQPLQQGWPGVMSGASATPITPNAVTVYPATGRALERNSGVHTLLVPVRLDRASSKTVTVHYGTMTDPPDFAAAVPQDYDATSGTLSFAPGETQKNIGVTIKGETVREPTESFLVMLWDARNANIGGFGGMAIGQIINDD
jgi:hypothetical protein